jgi:hypothetical protein
MYFPHVVQNRLKMYCLDKAFIKSKLGRDYCGELPDPEDVVAGILVIRLGCSRKGINGIGECLTGSHDLLRQACLDTFPFFNILSQLQGAVLDNLRKTFILLPQKRFRPAQLDVCAYPGLNLVKLKRLGDKIHPSGMKPPYNCFRIVQSAQKDDRYVFEMRILFDPFAYLKTIHAWHANIQQDNIRRFPDNGSQCSRTISE